MSVHKKRMKLSHDETNKFLTENATLTKITEEEFVSVRDTIFFQNPETHKFETCGLNLPSKYIRFMEEHNFPMKLKLFWLILGNPDDEIKTNGFTFMNLNQIEKDKINYKWFLDLGFQYYGMGHVIVLSLDKTTGKLFIRRDGGSNGFEREAYSIYYRNKNPSRVFKDKLMDMDQIFELLKSYKIKDNIPIVNGY
jgi:hypothetical protein